MRTMIEPAGGIVVGALDRAFDDNEADRVLIHIGEHLTLVLPPALAMEITDALADVLSMIDDPATVWRS